MENIENSISKHLNFNFLGGACPQDPLGSSRLWHSKSRLPPTFPVGTSTSKLIDSTVKGTNCQHDHANLYMYTVESRFLEPSVSRTSRYLKPNLVSIGFASLKLYNFTPDFSNPRFLKTPDNLNQFWLQWDKLTLHNSNLRKFANHLERMSITFTPLNKQALPDKLFSRILITQQASHKSVISLKGEMTASDCQHSLNWAMQSACLAHSAFLLMMRTSIIQGTKLRLIQSPMRLRLPLW